MPILKPGETCEVVAPVATTGVIVDARDYYLSFCRAALTAEHHLLLAGWQFDSDVPLLRGSDRDGATHPAELLPFLKHLCEQKPELRVYVLAWDYSLLYALEREWMQRLRFDWLTTERIRFLFDDSHATGGSHHQKFVVVDETIAFAGGIDLCHSRWDDRRHALDQPSRLNRQGKPHKPYHDCMAYVTGPAVNELTRLFRTRWEHAGGEPLELSAATRGAAVKLAANLPLDCRELALSLTYGKYREQGAVEQIKKLHEDAIASAERLIYIESQYFTSRAVHRALAERLRAGGSPLEVVIVLPRGADSPKEKFALGDAQNWVLSSLASIARDQGHRLHAFNSAAPDAEGKDVATFIHSKILCVDDRLLTLGSANCTNRSMSLDSELNVVWECAGEGDPLSSGIARVRASLLCEHAGIDYDPTLERSSGLVDRLHELVGVTKLRTADVLESPLTLDQDPLLERAFDPEQPLTDFELEQLVERRHD